MPDVTNRASASSAAPASGLVVDGTAFYDAVSFNDLLTRITPSHLFCADPAPEHRPDGLVPSQSRQGVQDLIDQLSG